MEAIEHTEAPAGETERALQGVFRYYELAKRAEWQVRDMAWGDIPPIPEYTGSPQKLARRKDLWRSVITQQLQADELAVEMATQLFSIAPDREAKLYYTTMVQDEARHTEAWLKLVEEAGGMAERDPYLDQLAATGARGRHPRGEGLHDAGLLRAPDHPAVSDDRPLLPRDRARGSLQPAGDRRRHPPRRRHGVRARAAARVPGRSVNDPARRGGQPAAAASSRSTRSGGRRHGSSSAR